MNAVTVNTALGQQGRPGHSMTLGTRAMGLFLSFDPREDKMPTADLTRKTLDGSFIAGPRGTDWKAKLPRPTFAYSRDRKTRGGAALAALGDADHSFVYWRVL